MPMMHPGQIELLDHKYRPRGHLLLLLLLLLLFGLDAAALEEHLSTNWLNTCHQKKSMFSNRRSKNLAMKSAQTTVGAFV